MSKLKWRLCSVYKCVEKIFLNQLRVVRKHETMQYFMCLKAFLSILTNITLHYVRRDGWRGIGEREGGGNNGCWSYGVSPVARRNRARPNRSIPSDTFTAKRSTVKYVSSWPVDASKTFEDENACSRPNNVWVTDARLSESLGYDNFPSIVFRHFCQRPLLVTWRVRASIARLHGARFAVAYFRTLTEPGRECPKPVGFRSCSHSSAPFPNWFGAHCFFFLLHVEYT